MPQKKMIPVSATMNELTHECTIVYGHPVKDWGKVESIEWYMGRVKYCSRCDLHCPIAHNVEQTGVSLFSKLHKDTKEYFKGE